MCSFPRVHVTFGSLSATFSSHTEEMTERDEICTYDALKQKKKNMEKRTSRSVVLAGNYYNNRAAVEPSSSGPIELPGAVSRLVAVSFRLGAGVWEPPGVRNLIYDGR